MEGGSTVRASLSRSGKCVECPVSDKGDGTYTVTVQPNMLGQSKLAITINGQRIQSSPFSLNVVSQRNYSTIRHAVKAVSIDSPRYIAFSNIGEVFATGEQCICVFDGTSGKLKSTIDSENFSDLNGLAIIDDFLFVVDRGNSKIHKLTTAGEYLDSFGEEGTDPGQLSNPCAIAVSPEGKIYVSDCGCRVQVFSPDCSLSHVIDGGGS